MLLKAALNGPFGKGHHPAMPETAAELAADAVACVLAGAGAIHIHPRDGAGRETLDPEVVDSVTRTVRSACGVPVGVSTGSWIEPDLSRRLAQVASWTVPDFASVNVSDEGFERVIQVLLDVGIGVEAGVWSPRDVGRLIASGYANRLLRVLVEPVAAKRSEGVAAVDEIHAALDAGGVTSARLQHGDGDAAWVILEDAVDRGFDTRIGLEDTLLGRDDQPTEGNAALVAQARAIGAGVV